MVTNNDIREFLDLPVTGTRIEIKQVDTITENTNTLMFVANTDIDLNTLDSWHNNVYLIDESYDEFYSTKNDFIRIKNPKYKFCKIVNYFKFVSKLQRYNMIHKDYYYDTKYRNEKYYNKIYCDTDIVEVGKNFQADTGTIIGGTDFSPVLGDDGELVQFPQMGGLIIGDNVVVKYNSMIGKGTFGCTQIGDNTMIDYNCQIGHNCVIGNSCIIAAGTIIGGSTTIGDNTVVGIGSMIRNGLNIGNHVNIGMGSVVLKDIPNGATVVGNPAKIIDNKKMFSERGLI